MTNEQIIEYPGVTRMLNEILPAERPRLPIHDQGSVGSSVGFSAFVHQGNKWFPSIENIPHGIQ